MTWCLCIDRNECSDMPFPCHIDAECTNNVGSFSCNCRTGFVGDGINCTGEQTTRATCIAETIFLLLDIDECLETPRRCEDVCTNTHGSFTCSCARSGYQLATDGRNCVGKSVASYPLPNYGLSQLQSPCLLPEQLYPAFYQLHHE